MTTLRLLRQVGLVAGGEAAEQTVAPSVWAALERAVRQGDAWEAAARYGAPAAASAGAVVRLQEAVRDATEGEALSLRDTALLQRGEPLLAALRHAFLKEIAALDEAIPPVGVVRVLLGFERVQQALAEERERATSAAARLLPPEALELLVQVAHDIRSPLTSILLLVETLRRGHSGPVTSVQERQLGLVYSAAFSLSSIASDAMELARGGDGVLDQRPIPFSIREVMHGVRDVVQPIAEEKELIIRLAPTASDIRTGYPTALHRVLLNLTANALKFTEKGTVELAAHALTRRTVEFSVADTGPGISSDMLSMLFEPFQLGGGAPAYRFSSSGLGLFICRKIVALMESKLEVDTIEGVGTRFHFTLELPPAHRV